MLTAPNATLLGEQFSGLRSLAHLNLCKAKMHELAGASPHSIKLYFLAATNLVCC